MKTNYIRIENHLRSNGLKGRINREILLQIGKHESQAYEHILRFVIDYIEEEEVEIKSGETLVYYSWVLSFEAVGTDLLEIYEIDALGARNVPGADIAIDVITKQMLMCNNYGSEYHFPRFGQKIAVSEGVLDGLPSQGVRYHAPEHMTGWYLTTELYDGNVDNMSVIGIEQIAFKLPNVYKFLALKPGFRFNINDGEFDIWFDDKINSEG